MNTGLILLAAGGSARLGSPKQLLRYRGRTLLRHAAETALATVCRPVVVVLGAGVEKLRAELDGLDVRTVENPSWDQGMGTSVRLGVETLLEMAAVEAALLMLCDQPLVPPASLNALVAALHAEPARLAAASAYDGAVGVPAVFRREVFPDLLALPAGAGAKAVLQNYYDNLVLVAMPEAASDIDTREQYERLR